MSYSVLQAKADLTGALHGTTLNQIQNLDGVFDRAARQLLLDIDPQETKRIVQTTTPIYNQVYDYACPSDLKGNRIIDIRPQVNRLPSDIVTQAYNRDFDAGKSTSLADKFTMNFNSGLKTLRIAENTNMPSSVLINGAESIADNGTWAVTVGSNLAVDNVNFVAGSGSLKFNSTATQAVIQNLTMESVDLTDSFNEGRIFFYVYLPDASAITNVVFYFGSGIGDYYTSTITTTFEGTAFQNGWNLLAVKCSSCSSVGAPDITAINFLDVAFNVTSQQLSLRINNVVCQVGKIMEIEYYSKFLFRDSITGAFQEVVTDDSNLINLDTESYNLYFNLLCYLVGQQQQGVNATVYDGKFFSDYYVDGVKRYKGLYKSEVALPHSTYYQQTKPGYSKYFNRRPYY